MTTFTGFKGRVIFAQIGQIQFALIAKSPAQLRALWAHVMPDAGPLDPAGIKHAILIESSTLPCTVPKLPPHQDALDLVNAVLEAEERNPSRP
jgi:hypothetical protein